MLLVIEEFFLLPTYVYTSTLSHAHTYAYLCISLYTFISQVSTKVCVSNVLCYFATAEAEKSKKDNEDTAKSEARHGRLRSLSDVLFRSELSSSSQEGRYDREDSDYEEEMELDFETSISGDEGRDNEPSILRGSLNLRFHRRDDSARENWSTEGSHGSPSSSSQHEDFSYQVFYTARIAEFHLLVMISSLQFVL